MPTCANGADATTLPAASSSAIVPRSPIARYDARIVSPAAPGSRRAENDVTRARAAGALTGSGGATANDAVRETAPSGPCTVSATETRCDALDAGSAKAISPLRCASVPLARMRPSSDDAA